MLKWVAFFGVCWWSSVDRTWAQVEPFSLDGALSEWFDRGAGNPSFLHETGRRIVLRGEAHGNCDSLLLGYGLMLRAHNDSPHDIPKPEFNSPHCALTGLQLLQEVAYECIITGRPQEAVGWYERALPFARTDQEKSRLFQSIGTCYVQMDQTEEASKWYVASADLGMAYLSAVSLSNLAFLSLSLGRPRQCLEWGRLAEMKLVEEFQSGLTARDFALRLDLVLLNELLAYLELGELGGAESVYNRMSMEEFYPQMGGEFYHGALFFAWALNDPYPIFKHEAAFSAALAEDSARAVRRFGPTVALLEPWRSAWEEQAREGASVWAELVALPDSLLPEVVVQLAGHGRPGARFPSEVEVALGWLGVALIALLAAPIGGGVLRRRRALQAAPDLLGQIRSALLNPTPSGRRRGLRSLLAVRDLASISRVPPDLKRREIEVIHALLERERPKVTAARLGLSTKSIYILRSDLKKTLNVPREVSLEDWVHQQFKGDE